MMPTEDDLRKATAEAQFRQFAEAVEEVKRTIAAVWLPPIERIARLIARFSR